MVFAQTPGGTADMGALLKQVLTSWADAAAAAAILRRAEFPRASMWNSFCGRQRVQSEADTPRLCANCRDPSLRS